ncbi:MAG: hypothetical protein KGI37_09460 [Alphaproteobacteria bacterium]|nr:hypothetical protein [Alphaproteobacteria bacterium]
MPEFSDENIFNLFGTEAAEDETIGRFKEYFFYNNTYANLISSLPLRILVGQKGIGKSSLLKRAYLHDQEDGTLALWLKPGDVASVSTQTGNPDFVARVEHWKEALIKLIAQQILGDKAEELLQSSRLKTFASRISSFIPALTDVVSKNAESIGAVFDKAVISSFIAKENINIYIDDIDRGWSATSAAINNISALLSAMRDITGSEQKIRFRLGLRSDVYFLVRTADESTDKIEGNVIWLSWTNHDILCIMAKRIETFFDKNSPILSNMQQLNQADITKLVLSKVIDANFSGAGHWSNRPIHNVLLSLTRRRPRDLVKLMHGAAKNAASHRHELISSTDLKASFESYSNERLQDIINEYRSELPDIEKLLLEMKPTKKERTTAESYKFTTASLTEKLKNVMGHVSFRFVNGRPVTARSLLQFLYKIDFITARKDGAEGIDRRYFDRSRFLATECSDFGFDWEIHPAYRWALQPQDVNSIFDTIDGDVPRNE